MPWVVTIKVTDCATSALLVGASMWDGSQTVFTDSNAQVIWYIDDYFTSYTVQISKSSYNSKTFVMVPAMNGTLQAVCLNTAPPPPPTCFTGETRVTLADGTEMPIAQIREGDLVLGRSGEHNRVIGIDRPLLGNRRLYALNGGDPFVTAEHPFLTEEGWKAVDPDATAAENPHLIVGRLAVKDLLVVLQGCAVPAGHPGAGECEPVLESVPLAQLEARRAAPETQLYNLLLDGDHAYFANGWLVHNKSTGCFIVSAATGSPQSEEVTQLRQLRDRVAGASRLSAQLIDVIYQEYYQFSPEIAADIQRDVTARQAVLWTIVRPLLAWYKLAGTLAFEHSEQDVIKQASQDLVTSCPKYLGPSSIAAVLKSIRNGEELPTGTSQLLREFAPRIREATRFQFASWAILDPLVRIWSSAANNLDVVDEVSQWLATAPLESLPPPGTPGELDMELRALADLYEFDPAARRQLGKRLMAVWPSAADVLKGYGFA